MVLGPQTSCTGCGPRTGIGRAVTSLCRSAFRWGTSGTTRRTRGGYGRGMATPSLVRPAFERTRVGHREGTRRRLPLSAVSTFAASGFLVVALLGVVYALML